MLDDIDAIEQLGVSINRAAKALDCSNRHIYNLHYNGVLRFFKVGRSPRVPPKISEHIGNQPCLSRRRAHDRACFGGFRDDDSG